MAIVNSYVKLPEGIKSSVEWSIPQFFPIFASARLSHGAPGDTPAIFDVAQSWEDAATGDAQDDGQLGAMGKRGKMGGWEVWGWDICVLCYAYV